MVHAVEIKKIHKFYTKVGGKKFIALDNIDLLVPQGIIFGLLGPNGAGKSTLINILAGIVIQSSGSANIMGYDINTQTALAKKQIGIVPQEIALDSFFPLSQALEFTAGYYGIHKKQRRTEEILKALGLWDKRDALPRQLSGGMKRRFLIAKALAHSPKVLILDEPTAGVDVELRDKLWEYVKHLNTLGTTVIITTHYLAEAQELCDNIAFINHGKIIKQDSKNNLLSTFSDKYILVEFNQNISSQDLVKMRSSYELINNNKIKIKCNSDDINDVLSQINSINYSIKDMSVIRTDIETIFKQLIKNSNLNN